MAGSESRMLESQMMSRKILAQVFDIRGFRGRTIAMYLLKRLGSMLGNRLDHNKQTALSHI